MMNKLESTGGLIFSGQLLLDLAEAGMLREDAYRLVQGHAMRAWKEDLNFQGEVMLDPAITKLLSQEKLEKTFDYTRQLRECGCHLQARSGVVELMSQLEEDDLARLMEVIRHAVEADEQNNTAFALRIMTAVVEEFPVLPIGHSYLGWILSRSNQYREAIAHCRSGRGAIAAIGEGFTFAFSRALVCWRTRPWLLQR